SMVNDTCAAFGVYPAKFVVAQELPGPPACMPPAPTGTPPAPGPVPPPPGVPPFPATKPPAPVAAAPAAPPTPPVPPVFVSFAPQPASASAVPIPKEMKIAFWNDIRKKIRGLGFSPRRHRDAEAG